MHLLNYMVIIDSAVSNKNQNIYDVYHWNAIERDYNKPVLMKSLIDMLDTKIKDFKYRNWFW